MELIACRLVCESLPSTSIWLGKRLHWPVDGYGWRQRWCHLQIHPSPRRCGQDETNKGARSREYFLNAEDSTQDSFKVAPDSLVEQGT